MTSDAEDGTRAVYDAHYGPLVGWTTRLVGHADPAHAVATAAFVRLLRQWSSVEDPRTWLYSDVVRRVLARWRAADADRDTLRSVPGSRRARQPTIRDVVRALPEHLREVVLLRMYADLPLSDVAQATGRSEATLRRELTEALQAHRRTSEVRDWPSPEAEQVEEFFATERAAAGRASAGEDRWEQILHQAAHRDRSWFWPVAALLAVTALLIAGWSVRQEPFGVGRVDRGPKVDASTASSPAVPSGAPGRTSSVQDPRPVPVSFVPWSLSNSGSGTLYAIGSSECGDDVCPTVVRSTDNGTTWAAVHRFAKTDTASVNTDEVPRIQPRGAVTEVRFATPSIGYAFGGDLWVTRDGGRSFSGLPHAGETVLDVEISGDEVVVLTADGCTQGRCTGPLMVSRGSVRAARLQQPVAIRALDANRPIDAAQLVVRDGQVYVEPSRVEDDLDAPWRLAGGGLVPMAAPRSAGCGRSALHDVTVATNGPATLFALCGGQVRAGQAEYRLLRSDDSGRTWVVASPTPLLVPRVGRLTLAASDARHLAVGVGGPRTAAGPAHVPDPSRLLQVSADGGRTWRPVSTPRPPPQGMDWVASPGGRELYAITRTGSAIWRSADLGATWQTTDPSRPVNPPATSSTHQPSR